ncbi:MAG: bifunctional diguanylate cyclase/phosphodiesterase [Gammaproteobacteria bacterium]
MNHGEHPRLVIIEETENKAESHASCLRNAGFPVRFIHVRDIATLEVRLEQAIADMVLCGEGPGLPDLESVTRLLQKYPQQIPVIAIAGEAPEDALVAARTAGAAALVSYHHPENLQLAYKKEQEYFQLRHRASHLEYLLEESEKRCHDLMETSRDAIAYIHEGMHVYANHTYLEKFGFGNNDEIEGTPILDMIDPAHHDNFKKYLRNYDSGDSDTNTLAIRGVAPDGSSFDAVMEFSPSRIDNEDCTQIIIRARTDADLEKQLDTLSRQDILTGLSNRQHFMQIVADNILDDSKDTERTCVVLYILIDNFKKLTENISVSGRDLIIKEVANRIGGFCAEQDSVARFGDCSYAILHRDSSMDGILEWAGQIRQGIAEQVCEVEDRAVALTCSIGVCVINGYTRDAQNVLSRADLACEVARSSGGNQIHVHSTAVDEQMDREHELDWDEIIRKTIAEERCYLMYQPVVSLGDDSAQHYEVLLRISDENGHIILPGQYLAIAEKTGVSGDIDRWVIDAALKKLAATHQDGRDTRFFIKVSQPMVYDAEFPAWICGKLEEYRLGKDCVIFEVAESAAVNDLKNTMLFVETMQQLECKSAIEHYGCSSQPTLLRHLPVNMVKIDGSLVNHLADNEEALNKVRAIIELAKEAGMQCVAERVDEAANLALLWQSGVDYIQGNFVQEPGRELGYDFEGEIA